MPLWARARARRPLAFALCLALLSAPALAEPSAAEKETARKLVKSGRAKQKSGDMAGALEDLKGAHAIMNVPTTGLALGKAQLDAGRLVEARDTLLSVARIAKQGREPFAFTKARATAKTLAADIEPRVPQLELDLNGAAEGSDVRVNIDGVEFKPAALGAAISLNPGEHTIVISVNGDKKETTTSLSEGQKSLVSIDLSGLGMKKAPPKPLPITDSPSQTDPLVYVGFGVAGVGVLVGSVTGVMALSKASSAKDGCTSNRCPPATHDDIDASSTLGTVSTVSFVLGGVGAVVGVWGLTRSGGSSEKPPGASASVWLGPASAGVSGKF